MAGGSFTPAAIENDALLRSRVDAIYAIQLPMIVMDLLGAVLVASYFWDLPQGAWLRVWFAICAVMAIPRFPIAIAYLSGSFPSIAPISWARSATTFAAISGLLWGIAVGWMMAIGTDNQVMFVVCVALSGVTMSIANVTYWPVYAVFAGPATAAAAIGSALSQRPGHMLLAGGAASLMVALLITSKSLGRQVLHAHRLALTNQVLVQSLGDRGRELERAFSALEQVSRTDPLTGIANRRSRDSRLSAEWNRATRIGGSLSVIAIDVDHFKRYNDSHGHDEGDRCLQAVSAMLQGATRGAMDMAARQGGEEFMLILPGIGEDAVASIAERVRVAVARCHENFDLPERVTISLGVATMEPSPDRSVRELTMAADAALYRAKVGGRNRYEVATISDIGTAVA
jgi:diguanylate cyclase (GGDEF)-like protein